jgi:hypothetical protein
METLKAVFAADVFDSIICLGMIGAFDMGMRYMEGAAKLGKKGLPEHSVIKNHLVEIENNFLNEMINLMEKHNKPIYPVALFPTQTGAYIHSREGSKYRVITYRNPEEAVMCLAKQHAYYRYITEKKVK